MPKNYYVSEGNKIGGQEPQALGTVQKRITASADITKGQPVEVSGDWTVAPASADSVKYAGIAFMDYKSGEEVVVDTEGFVKLDASGAITAGNEVVCAGTGKVKAKGASAGNVVGIAFNTAADGGVVYVKLR